VFMLDEGEGEAEDQECHLHIKCKLMILINQTLVFISLIHLLICKANFLLLSNIESSLSHGTRRISSEA